MKNDCTLRKINLTLFSNFQRGFDKLRFDCASLCFAMKLFRNDKVFAMGKQLARFAIHEIVIFSLSQFPLGAKGFFKLQKWKNLKLKRPPTSR